MPKNSTPAVSVRMNSYNSEEYRREAIDSVYNQTYKDWEIIFWDDASTDSSSTIAKSDDEKVRYFLGGEAASLGEARNLAIKQARGKYIAFLDCDDVWLPEKLEKQVARFEEDERVGLVFSDALFFNAKGDEWPGYGRKRPLEGNIFRHTLVHYNFALVAVMVRAVALESMRGEVFDRRFGFIEEMDLFLRVLHDWRGAFVPEVLAKYRMHEKSWTFSRGLFFPQEKEILIQKLSALYPNFEKDYKEELTALRRHVAYEKFLLYWRNKEASKARLHLRPFVGASFKMTVFYCLSFLTFTTYLKMRKIVGKKYYSI